MVNVLRDFGKAFLTTCLVCPQLTFADDFTSADVLEWDSEAQENYFQTSIGMIAVIGTQTNHPVDIVECLNAWYWPNGHASQDSNAFIRDAMELYPDLHPQAIILAAVEKMCGPFKPN